MIEIERNHSDKEGLTHDEILFAKKHDLTHDEMLGYIHDMEKEAELIRQSTIEAMDLELASYHQALDARETKELQAEAAENEAIYVAEMAAENAWLVNAERKTEDDYAFEAWEEERLAIASSVRGRY